MNERNGTVREVNLDEMSSRYDVPVPPGRIDRVTFIQQPSKNAALVEAIREMKEELAACFDSTVKDLAATLTNARPASSPTPVTRLEPTASDGYLLPQIPPYVAAVFMQCLRQAVPAEISAAELLTFAGALESGRVTIRCAINTAPNRRSDGSTTLHPNDSIEMIINIASRDLARVCHHEQRHLFDLLRYARQLSKKELEARATAHTERMLTPSPKPALPEPEPTRAPRNDRSLRGGGRWYS